MDRSKIIDEIQRINSKLSEIHSEIVKHNEDGNQFDYVNSPILADTVDILEKWTKRIEKIVYQK